jgi:hypothetical protein
MVSPNSVNRDTNLIKSVIEKYSVRYDPETGIISRKLKNGKIVAAVPGIRLTIGEHACTTNTLIWYMMVGSFPGGRIIHRDGDLLNFRWSNLSLLTISQCMQKRSKLSSNNTSGFKGVSRVAKNNQWLATIGYNNKTLSLGSYPTIKDAAKAYNIAALKFFGGFAQLNNIENPGHLFPAKDRFLPEYKDMW